MIINRFSARKVHGAYDFNIEFHRDLNFLVGINGSGKTTALRLIQASLSIDLNTLTTIQFSSLKIELEKDGMEHTLIIIKNREQLVFTINGSDFEFTLPPMFIEEQKLYPSEKFEENMEIQRLHFLRDMGSTAIKFIADFRPMFLGLERRLGRYDDDSSLHDRMIMEYRHYRSKKEILEGLDNCQKLIERAYKQYRRVSDGSMDRLINIIIESTFEYTEFNPDYTGEKLQTELSALQQKREEIERFVTSVGNSSKVSQQIDRFFKKLSDIRQIPNNDSKELYSIEWLMNLSQINRIKKIVTELDRQKKSAERQYAPIKEFTACINKFMQHSKKELSVDSLGKIVMEKHGNKIPLTTLSSGEKQLLILLTHARFGLKKRSCFIVDEPELSLHMHWQEMLVDSLVEENEKTNQFIFATHSPEIVGYHTNKCIQLG